MSSFKASDLDPAIAKTDPILSNTVYDRLKRGVQLVIPASSALYFALAGIWGWPYGEEITGSLAALAVFLGVVLEVSSRQYKGRESNYDGVLKIDTTDPDKDVYDIQLNASTSEVANKGEASLKVTADSK